MTALLDRFRDHLDQARLFRGPGTALVAVSGGPDSVALLDLMHAVAAAHGLSLVVAHVDHGIHPESRTVGRMVRELAERYGLPFALGELGLGPGATETIARQGRYAWLGEARRHHGARYIVTAHHQDDQVETILLRVLKGSAPAGLAGMPARGRGGVVRPLLPFTRAELEAHLLERGLSFHDDPANRDPRHLRSWVRTELLPRLAERLGPRVRADILRLGRSAATERRAWDRVLELLPDLQVRFGCRQFDIAREGLARYDDSVSVALVRAAARRAGLVLGVRRAEQVIALARHPSGRHLPLGADGWVAEVAFGRLRVFGGVNSAPEEVVATAERGSAVFGSYRVEWAPESAPARLSRSDWTTWIGSGLGDAGGTGGTGGTGGGGRATWEVRAPRPGDRLVPLGGVGNRPVRRLLMEARVPRSARASYPVVARGETILWVPGICRSAVDLPQPGTPAVRVHVSEHGEPEAERRD